MTGFQEEVFRGLGILSHEIYHRMPYESADDVKQLLSVLKYHLWAFEEILAKEEKKRKKSEERKTAFWCAVITDYDDGRMKTEVVKRECAEKPRDTIRRPGARGAVVYEEWFFTEEEARLCVADWEHEPGIRVLRKGV